MNNPRIVFLDLLRVFAVASVVVGHKFYQPLAQAAVDPGVHVTLRALAAITASLAFGGAAGVVVFFLVSGYIITHVLQHESAGQFLVKRAFRIYPLYMTAVVLEASLGSAVFGYGVPEASEFLIRLLLLGDVFGTVNALAAVEWTLRIEMAFYVVMALLRRTGVLTNTRAMPVVAVVATAVLHLATPLPATGDWNHGYITLYAPFLAVGVLIYLAQVDRVNRIMCGIASVIILGAFLAAIPNLQPTLKEHHYAVLAMIIVLTFQAMNGNFSDLAVVRRAADVSYALYLLHNWLWAHIALIGSAIGLSGVLLQVSIVAVVICLSWLLHRWVEVPGIRLGKTLAAHLTAGQNWKPVERFWLTAELKQ